MLARACRSVARRLRPLGFGLSRLWHKVSCPNLTIRTGARISPSARLKATDGGSISIGRGCTISRGVTIVAKRGHIFVGDNVFVGSWTTITARKHVSIGADCLIAERVSIRDQDHQIHGDIATPIRSTSFEIAPISIGENVWIAAGAVILKGVSIERGAVVAANAVVVKSVEQFEIVGGVPAARIGMRTCGTLHDGL